MKKIDIMLTPYFSTYYTYSGPGFFLIKDCPSSVVSYFAINNIDLSETKIGLIDNEETFYYEFDVKKENGIHGVGKNTYDDLYKGYMYINLIDDNYTKTQTIDMSEIETLNIDCPSYAILNIKEMKGFEIDVYREPKFAEVEYQIDDDSSSKIIKLGNKKSKLEIKRKGHSSAKSISSSNDIFSYSYMNLENVKKNRNNVCNEIFVSNDPNFKYLIKNTMLEDNDNIYNYTLSPQIDYCMWFTFPVKTKLTIDFHFSSTHNGFMYYNDRANALIISPANYEGYNFIYVLRYKNYDKIEPGWINISASPIPDSNDPPLENNGIINIFIDYDYHYELIDIPKGNPIVSNPDNEPIITSTNNKNDEDEDDNGSNNGKK